MVHRSESFNSLRYVWGRGRGKICTPTNETNNKKKLQLPHRMDTDSWKSLPLSIPPSSSYGPPSAGLMKDLCPWLLTEGKAFFCAGQLDWSSSASLWDNGMEYFHPPPPLPGLLLWHRALPCCHRLTARSWVIIRLWGGMGWGWDLGRRRCVPTYLPACLPASLP